MIDRLARGLTVKIEWEMTGEEAPAAPARVLQQYGVDRSGTGYLEIKHKDENGKPYKRRIGWCYVRPSQAEWADYVLRRTGQQWTVTSPPIGNNSWGMHATGLGPSWGAPRRALGFGGMLDDLIAWGFGYRFTRGKRGIEHMSPISGIVNRTAKTKKQAKRNIRRFWRELF